MEGEYVYNPQAVYADGLYLRYFIGEVRKQKCLMRIIPKHLVPGLLKYIEVERQLYQQLDSKYFLKPASPVLATNDSYVWTYEICNGGPLSQYVKKMGEQDIRELLQQLTVGLCVLHEIGYVLRVLTPETIFVHEENGHKVFKIADIMLAKPLADTTRPLFNAYPYLAPELRLRPEPGPCTQVADIYSLGVLVTKLLTGSESPSASLEGLSTELKHLLQRCLVPDPTARITLIEVMMHPFMREAERLTKQFELKEELGRGGFAEAWGCIEKATGRAVVVKKIFIHREYQRLDQFDSPNASLPLRLLYYELSTMYRFGHTNVSKDGLLPLYYHFIDDSAICLVLPWCLGRSMQDLIKNNPKGLSVPLVRKLGKQLIVALYKLHSLNIVHRDLKPANVLLTSPEPEKADILLADYGLAKQIKDEATFSLPLQNVLYGAYEAIDYENETRYSTRYDIWSYGIILYELAYGHHPGQPSNHDNIPELLAQVRNNGKAQFALKEGFGADFQKLVLDCINPAWRKRPFANEIMSRSFFGGPPAPYLTFWSLQAHCACLLLLM